MGVPVAARHKMRKRRNFVLLMRLSPAYGSPPMPLDDDGLPLDEVGAWAKEKHERLRRYVDISRGARRKFARGGTTYVDLYCGTGRAHHS